MASQSKSRGLVDKTLGPISKTPIIISGTSLKTSTGPTSAKALAVALEHKTTASDIFPERKCSKKILSSGTQTPKAPRRSKSASSKRPIGKVHHCIGASGNPVPRKVQVKNTSSLSTVKLLCGTQVPKNHKLFEAIAIIDELTVLIGMMKIQYFPIESKAHQKSFVSARLTAIREHLSVMKNSILITPAVDAKFSNSRFDKSFIEELKLATESMNCYPFSGFPEKDMFEAQIFMMSVIARNLSRALLNIQDSSLSIYPDSNAVIYAEILSDYFLYLITYVRSLDPIFTTDIS